MVWPSLLLLQFSVSNTSVNKYIFFVLFKFVAFGNSNLDSTKSVTPVDKPSVTPNNLNAVELTTSTFNILVEPEPLYFAVSVYFNVCESNDNLNVISADVSSCVVNESFISVTNCDWL